MVVAPESPTATALKMISDTVVRRLAMLSSMEAGPAEANIVWQN